MIYEKDKNDLKKPALFYVVFISTFCGFKGAKE